MGFCYEITAVPIARQSNPIVSPAAELAARLQPGQTLTVRLHRGEDRIHCYVESDAGDALTLGLRHLAGNGYVLAPGSLPFPGRTGILLGRYFCQRTLLTPGQPARRVAIPGPLEPGVLHGGAFMDALYAMPGGCGLHLSIRRLRELSVNTVTTLHRMQCEEVSPFLYADPLYQVVGCLYGPSSVQNLLLPEVRYAFPGLCPVSVPEMAVSHEILDRYRNPELPETLRELAAVMLPGEVEALTDLSASAGNRGLPLNKDTLFGIPRELPKPKGRTLSLGAGARGQPVEIPLEDLCRHVLVCAPSGMGKGNLMIHTALQLHSRGIPFLILEGQKREAHALHRQIPTLKVWEPKEGAYVFNPLSLPEDIRFGEYRNTLGTILTQAFDAEGVLEPLFKDALNQVFYRHGYTDLSKDGDKGTVPFGLSEYMEAFSALLQQNGYSAKTQADVSTGGKNRLQSLFNESLGVFDSVRSIPLNQLLTGQNVLQLNCLSGDARQVFASLLLLQIAALFRLRGTTAKAGEIRMVILLDEAHTLLQNTVDAQGKAHCFAALYEEMLKTLRSQGIGMITISQTTEGIPRRITDACETKLFLGASPYSGMEEYRALFHGDDTALEHLYLLGPGEGVYCKASLPAGVYFKSPYVLDRLKLEQEYTCRNLFLENNPRYCLETYGECAACPARGRCTRESKADARRLASVLLSAFSGVLTSEKAPKGLERLLTRICMETDDVPTRYCTLIQLVRDLNRSSPGALRVDDLMALVKPLWK